MPGFACFYRIFLRVLYRKKMYPTALKMWDTKSDSKMLENSKRKSLILTKKHNDFLEISNQF